MYKFRFFLVSVLFIIIFSSCKFGIDKKLELNPNTKSKKIAAKKTNIPSPNTTNTVKSKKPPTNTAKKNSNILQGAKPDVSEPKLLFSLSSNAGESWLGSPSITDLNADGKNELIVSRYNKIVCWNSDGKILFTYSSSGGRIWASPVICELDKNIPGLEIAFASREKVYVIDSKGTLLKGFPVTVIDELRSIASGDIDNDKQNEIIVVSTSTLNKNNAKDIIFAFDSDGKPVKGYPPNTSGVSGWDNKCYVTGGYDQNVAVGDFDNDKVDDIFATQDNAYLSAHKGNGLVFNSATFFKHPKKFLGVRFLLDYNLAKQGWANDENNSNQAHFTNSAPAITDVNSDGINDLLVLGSVQNASQTDRFRGVALWALRPDGTRISGWEDPFYVKEYLSGLWDFEGTNVVAATNQVSVGDLNKSVTGNEFVFAGFDGKIHCVGSNKIELWNYKYTDDKNILTGGVILADLTKDGKPEIIFNTYSIDNNKSNLFILSSDGKLQKKLALPGRGAMPVPSIGDLNNNKTLEIAVSLKDSMNGDVLIYEIPDSSNNYMPWPSGRGNNLRNGMVNIN